MGKGSKGKAGRKARRQAEAAALVEAAALARTTWLTRSAGRGLPADGEADGARSLPGTTDRAAIRPDDASVPSGAPAPPGSSAPPDTAAPPGPAELADRLASLGTHLQRQLQRGTEDGLTRARLSALGMLVLGGPRTLGELAAAEHVRPPTMTRLVQAMEADGLVTRARHPSDGRSIVIRATPQGEALLERGRGGQAAAMLQAIADLDAADRRRLIEGIDLVERIVREAGREARTSAG